MGVFEIFNRAVSSRCCVLPPSQAQQEVIAQIKKASQSPFRNHCKVTKRTVLSVSREVIFFPLDDATQQ